jgi:hypothetical protein
MTKPEKIVLVLIVIFSLLLTISLSVLYHHLLNHQ